MLLRAQAYKNVMQEFLVQDLTLQYERLSNQARFVLMIVNKELNINNRKKADVVAELRKREFRPFPRKDKSRNIGDPDAADEEEVADLADAGTAGDFDYLLSMGALRFSQMVYIG